MFEEYEADLTAECNAFWESLSKKDQLLAFCSVVSRLKKAEIDEARSYRGILYTTFEFGPEAYSAAQASGFVELHNSIYPNLNGTVTSGFAINGLHSERVVEMTSKKDNE